MGNYPQTFVTNMREFSVKFPAKQNLTLKNFLGTSSQVPLLFPAMLRSKIILKLFLGPQICLKYT